MVLNTNPNYYLKDNTNIFNLQINGEIENSVRKKLKDTKKVQMKCIIRLMMKY